jgi:hypothetical protein
VLLWAIIGLLAVSTVIFALCAWRALEIREPDKEPAPFEFPPDDPE